MRRHCRLDNPQQDGGNASGSGPTGYQLGEIDTSRNVGENLIEFQEVEDLKRVRIMNIQLGAMHEGQYREISGEELSRTTPHDEAEDAKRSGRSGRAGEARASPGVVQTQS